MTHSRLQWFIERIGKRVFRNKGTCYCDTCMRTYFNGVVINDHSHAISLFDQEHIFDGVRYFDTLEEVIVYEKELALKES